VQANPTSQIVPEFSGKDRFFDVSTGGTSEEILRSLRSEAMIQGNVMELAGDLETSGA